MTTEMAFVNTSPSVLATAALLTAIRAVLPHHDSALTSKAEEVTGLPAPTIESCVTDIEHMVTSLDTGLTLGLSHTAAPAVAFKHTMSQAHKSVICNSSHQQSATPETPTDVQDVLF